MEVSYLFHLQSQDNICHTVSGKVCGTGLHETHNPVLEPQFCVLLKLDKWPFSAWKLACCLGVFPAKGQTPEEELEGCLLLAAVG